MNKTIHFSLNAVKGKLFADKLRKDPQRTVAFMDWPDGELIASFNAGEYTDLVTTHRVGANHNFTVDADVIMHSGLLSKGEYPPFVVESNKRAPDAAIVYRYSDHFVIEGT